MAIVEKQEVLLVSPNCQYRFLKCEIYGKHAVDRKGLRAWHLLPRFVIPIIKNGKIISRALIVTDGSELPVDPTGKNDYSTPETLTCMDGLADLQNRTSNMAGVNEPNWVILAIVLLAIVIGIIAIVALIQAFY